MKFKIVPKKIVELDIFTKGNKEIWVQVGWGRYDWGTYTPKDFDAFADCKTK